MPSRSISLDLTECRIETPTGPALGELYRVLGEIFPPDRELFAWLLENGQPLYTWTPYTLYRREEIVGNVSLMPLRVWLDGRPMEVVGVASVATVAEFRRQGVARHLLQHCLALIDRQRRPAVLFTSQPHVYAGAGFVNVPQQYLEWRLPDEPFEKQPPQTTWLDRPTPEDWEVLTTIYRDQLADDDGKLVRDSDYWQFYQTLVRLNPHWRFVVCGDGRLWQGYARCEEEAGRLLVSEFGCPPDREDIAEALLGAIVVEARRLDRPVLSLALPPDHFLGRFLQSHGVKLVAEGPNAGREVFMVRPAAEMPLGSLARLPWSLADKF